MLASLVPLAPSHQRWRLPAPAELGEMPYVRFTAAEGRGVDPANRCGKVDADRLLGDLVWTLYA